jgi:hypothetical protein
VDFQFAQGCEKVLEKEGEVYAAMNTKRMLDMHTTRARRPRGCRERIKQLGKRNGCLMNAGEKNGIAAGLRLDGAITVTGMSAWNATVLKGKEGESGVADWTVVPV